MSEPVYQQVITLLPKLRRFAYGLSGSLDNADDLIQEACTRLLGCTTDVEGYLERWLYRTIRNIHIDQVRRSSVKARYQQAVSEQEPSVTHGDQQVESLITLEQVQALIGELPDEQQAAMILVGVEGYSYRETAEILGVPVGTVTSRIARARRRLVEAMSYAPGRQERVGT